MKQLRPTAVIAILLASSVLVVAQSPPGGNAPMQTPDHMLDNLARQATPTNPDSITALAHSVIAYPHVYGFPPEVAGLLESDLARDEIAYRNGLGPGVKEEQVLKLLNDLAAKFHMPDYVQTTPAQLRNLRMNLALNSPYFIGAGLTNRELHEGQSVNDTMSPLQAMHLVCVMVDQKVLNDLYQDPTIDIVRAEKERSDAYRREAVAKGSKAIVVGHSNPHGLEVRNVLSNGIASMSISDAYDLINQSMETIGLK
jgi:hypothetical protein